MTMGAVGGGGRVCEPEGPGDEGAADGARARGLGRGRGRDAVVSDIAVRYKDAIVGKTAIRDKVIHVT